MRTRFLSRVLLFSALLAGAAQLICAPPDELPTQLRGPVLGYVLDPGLQAVRPINGIPGASYLGPPLALPFPVTAAAFSSRSDFALIVSGLEDRTLYLLRNPGAAEPSLALIDGAISGADRIVLNAANSAAAIYVTESRQLQIVRGLPQNPAASPLVDLSSVSGKITALALDRSGSNLLIGASEAGQGGLYVASVAAGSEPRARLVSNFANPAAIVLLNRDQDALVTDAALNQLFLIRNFAASADIFSLAGEREGISNPVGLQTSADDRKVFIANQGTRSLDVWDLAAQSIGTRMALDAAPTRLVPLQASSTFLLNDVGDSPLLLLDTVETPAVYFVPAGRER